ncbi:MAG: hypothetical protein U0132_00400 [Gemmatimonadaceae bacterium]
MASSLSGRTPAYVAAIGDRNRLLAELRRRGSRGGVIAPHRAMLTGRLTPSLVVSILVIPVLTAVVMALALRPLGSLWGTMLRWLMERTSLPGDVALQGIELGPIFSFAVPYATTLARLPVWSDMVAMSAVCAILLFIAWMLPSRFLPLAYYLRFGVLVQLTAILVFAIRPDSFPYALPPYTASLMEIGAAVLVLMPLVYGCTLFPFDIALWRKLALSLMALGHLAMLVPLQVFIHAYVIHHLSLLVMPTMFFLWGILVHVFVFVAFYGWGMSWPEATPSANRSAGLAPR